MRHLVYILLTVLIPVLVGGLRARNPETLAAPVSSSEHDADGDNAPQDSEDPAGAQQPMLLAAREPVGPRAAAPRSCRLRIVPARPPRPAPM